MKTTRKSNRAWLMVMSSAALLGLAVISAGCNLLRETAESRPGVAENIRGRNNWFYEQRAYPKKTIPWGARLKAVEQMDRELARLRAEGTESANFNPNLAWTSLGPEPIGNIIGRFPVTFGTPRGAVSGRVQCIALHPQYNGASNQTVYIGTTQGGLWRSTNNGANWTPLTDDQPSLAIGDIMIDPSNPNTIYAGTGAISGYYGAGLLKSTDGGATWTQITGPAQAGTRPAFINASFSRLAIDPGSTNVLYAATTTGSTTSASAAGGDAPLLQRGIFKSTDGGQSWTLLNVTGSSQDNATDVFIDPLDPQRVFAAFDGQSQNNGVYRSNDGGQNWTKLSNGLPTANFTRITLAVGPAVAPATSATIYAAIGDPDRNLIGIFKTTDNGNTWVAVTRPQLGGQTEFNLPMKVDPTDGNTVYYGTSANAANDGGTLWRTTDGGATWNDLSRGDGQTGGLHADSHSIAISPANHNIVFTGNDGGVWRTNNAVAATVSWANLNAGLSTILFQAIALHPTDPNIVIGGTQDNGSNRRTTSNVWDNVAEGDGGFAYIDQSNPQVVYHTYQNEAAAPGKNPSYGPQRSTDGGATFTPVGCENCQSQPGGFNRNDRVGFFAPMNGHPGFTGANGNVVYFGTQRLYRTADRGQTWTGVGPSNDNFGTDLSKGDGRLSAITPHPQLDNNANPPGEIVWVGTSDGNVQVTIDAGKGAEATWTNVTKAPLPNRFVTDIAVDPRNRTTAIVAFSGFNSNTADTPGHVFRTTDRGQRWTSIDGNLPDVPVNSVVVDPVLEGVIWVGTDIGVFQTIDGGATWTPMFNGLPKAPVFMVRYQSASRSLFAATHGRGVFRVALEKAVATVSAADYARDKIAGESIVAAFGVNLATQLQTASSVPLPTSLAGTTVKVKDSAGTERLAPLFFVSAGQVNYQIPQGTAAGLAVVTITSSDGSISIGTEQIVNVGPALFTADASGGGFPAANLVRVRNGQLLYESVATRNAQNQLVAVPIDFGEPNDVLILVLYGTGIRKRSAQSAVTCTVGGTSAPVDYADFAPGFVGLDQVNVRLPRSLAGSGDAGVQLTVDGKTSRTVMVNFK